MPHVIYYCYMTNFGSHGLMNIVCYDTHPINDDWIEIHFKCIFGEFFYAHASKPDVPSVYPWIWVLGVLHFIYFSDIYISTV